MAWNQKKGGAGLLSRMGNQLEIKGRRRLAEAGVFENLLVELQTVLEELKAAPGGIVSDCDLSQNSITLEQFEMILNTFATGGVRVQRFRLFGCCTINDQAMDALAGYLRNDITSEMVPTEMHLSDCAITTDGWQALMSAIEDTELFPIPDEKTGKAMPLYLRMENNYIDAASIQEKIDAGVVRGYTKKSGSMWQGQQVEGGGAKVNLIVRDDGNFQQKQGTPPAPEDAPAPKQVWDKYTEGKGFDNGKGKGKWWGATSWPATPAFGKGGGKPAPAWNNQWSAAGAWPGGAALPQGKGVGASATIIRPAGGINLQAQAAGRVGAQVGNGGAQAWPARGTVGNAAVAADRSRTPVRPAQPAKPPPGKNGLPHPWEEHWSDEYSIPYFWNSETGDAAWEKPTA